MPLVLCSCTTVKETNNYGFFPKPGMDEDSQDRNNTKYNIMDSSDGSRVGSSNSSPGGCSHERWQRALQVG